MKSNSRTPEEVLTSLRNDLATTHKEIQGVWNEQAVLQRKEADLQQRRRELEQSIVLIQREFKLEPVRIPLLPDNRTRSMRDARGTQRRKSSSVVTLADANDQVLQETREGLTAAQVREKVLPMLSPRKVSITDVRVALSRYAPKRDWRKVSEERPIRWCAIPRTSSGPEDRGGDAKE